MSQTLATNTVNIHNCKYSFFEFDGSRPPMRTAGESCAAWTGPPRYLLVSGKSIYSSSPVCLEKFSSVSDSVRLCDEAAQVTLVNDFVLQGYAVSALPPDALRPLGAAQEQKPSQIRIASLHSCVQDLATFLSHFCFRSGHVRKNRRSTAIIWVVR